MQSGSLAHNVPQLNAVGDLKKLNYQLKNKINMEHENLNTGKPTIAI